MQIKFEDVIRAIKKYAFKLSAFPVILSLEVHTSIPQQKVLDGVYIYIYMYGYIYSVGSYYLLYYLFIWCLDFPNLSLVITRLRVAHGFNFAGRAA